MIKAFKKTLKKFKKVLQEEDGIIKPNLKTDSKTGVYGHVDSIDEKGIHGWFVNLDNPEDNELTIKVNGTEVGKVKPSFQREDINNILGKHVISGFFVPWENLNILKLEEKIVIEVFYKDKKLEKNILLNVNDIKNSLNKFRKTPLIPLENNNIEKMKKIIKESKLFDEYFYLENNPDVKEKGLDPIEHYLIYGVKEGKNPNKYFDTKFYLNKYPDVDKSGINPFIHYILSGAKEGRFPNPENEIYPLWIKRNEPTQEDLVKQKKKKFKYMPKISIIVPVWNTKKLFLIEMIESVLNQTYVNWELCIVDGGSDKSYIKEILEFYKEKDERIKVKYLDKNKGIIGNSNEALRLATGDFIAFLDHDDKIPEFALFYIVEEINRSPNAKIIYSDEDKIDINGNRKYPHFKSDWNPDLLLSQNYITHLLVIKKSIIDMIGGFRYGTEGAQDHDLVLRASLHCKEKEIKHIPKILYHWRMWEKSTSFDSKRKEYTEKSGIKAVKNYLEEKGIKDVRVKKGEYPNTYRVIYSIPKPEPLVSIIIPTKDKLDLLQNCINSIFDKTEYYNYEILIIDNNSEKTETLQYFEKLQRHKKVKIFKYEKDFNFSAICNYGVKNAKGELILLLNNDTEVINKEWLDEMVRHAVRPEIGCVGAKLYYQDKTIQHAGIILGIGGVAGHSHKYYPVESPGYMTRLKLVQNVSAVTGACLMVKKHIYQNVGGMNEINLKVAFNDVDFCLKVREAGYRNLWTPYAELYHYESKSRGFEDTIEKQIRFKKEIDYMKEKWGRVLQEDPYYNPNLSLYKEDFSINLLLEDK